MSTRKALRQALGKRLRECLTGTVDAAGSNYIVDADLIDTGEIDTAVYDGHWLYIASGTAAGDERRVSSYVNSTGTLYVGRDFSSTPGAGAEYELHSLLSPTDLNWCINESLPKLYYEHWQEVAVVEGQRQYSLASYTWLTDPAQVIGVYWKSGNTTAEYRYLPHEWYELWATGGTTPGVSPHAITLNIRPSAYASGQYLVLRCLRPFTSLTTDTDATTGTTACPDALVLAVAEWYAYKLLTEKGPATDVERYQKLMTMASVNAQAVVRLCSPRPSVRILQHDTTFRGIDSSIVR